MDAFSDFDLSQFDLSQFDLSQLDPEFPQLLLLESSTRSEDQDVMKQLSDGDRPVPGYGSYCVIA